MMAEVMLVWLAATPLLWLAAAGLSRAHEALPGQAFAGAPCLATDCCRAT